MNPMIGRETWFKILFCGEGLIRVHIRAKHQGKHRMFIFFFFEFFFQLKKRKKKGNQLLNFL
jgi:hypothetical protein